MRQVLLQGAGISVSRLSFGTASLHYLPTSSRRQDLLAAAFDHGMTHFDTAPSYGFGMAEQEVGQFVQGRQGRVTIATKVGLYPPGGSHPNTASVWLRKATGRVWPAVSRSLVDWSVAVASQSLDRSLRRLKIDHIDLLLLHEPLVGVVQSGMFLDWLKEEQGRGRIRAWGLAGPVDCLEPWLSVDHPLGMVLQVQDSLDGREADLVQSQGRALQLTYGYVSSSSTQPGSLNARAILEQAMRRNRTGSILVSTRQVAHVRELASIAERDDGDNH
ncbi:MAG: aldo/keto reductase [Nitrospirae bacterium]|nr:aldo/keto reductase [Nitrospirota bacterium]